MSDDLLFEETGGEIAERKKTACIQVGVGSDMSPCSTDSGSDICAINQDYLAKLSEKMSEKILTLPVARIVVKLAIASRPKKPRLQAQIPINLGGLEITINCLSVPDLNVNLILGEDFFFKYKATIHYGREHFSFHVGETRLIALF